MNTGRAIIVAFALFLIPMSAFSQNYFTGLSAYKEGNFETALKEWLPLAEKGVFRAQHNIGFMYKNGLGVQQDEAEAVRWFRLAAEQGEASAQPLAVVPSRSRENELVEIVQEEALKWAVGAALEALFGGKE